MQQETAILVCGHGSRDPDAMAEFERVALGLKARLAEQRIGSGYLEFARPTLGEALDHLIAHGARRILALPAMLFAAGHVKNDIPSELNAFAAATPGLAIAYARDLSIDPKLLRAAADRIEAALEREEREVERSRTLLLVVGRGTSDPDANSNVAKLTRMLWEGMGFGWAEYAFSGVAFPRVPEAIERARRLGFERIVVFPYFLFTGVLVKRIYAAVDAARVADPTLDIVKVDYLKDHPLVLDAMVDRLNEIDRGQNAMNCQLCKYREQIIGYENEVGTPQEGHHHHVRGIGVDGHHHHGHDHHHDHHHDHGHHHHHHGHEDHHRGHDHHAPHTTVRNGRG